MKLKTTHIIFFILLLAELLVIPAQMMAQNKSVTDASFRPPLGIPLFLSGTFGELRSNHFHSGIDIKTGGTTGKNVYAVADGYVSRIKISTGGYGKVLYVTHPNGYVSVYGHLLRFNDEIEEFVKQYQYRKESFTVEIFPDKDELKVTKGEAIALSGNTGSSQGPHLHFEIRDAATQHPLNPLLFENIKVKDFYRPKILEIAVYPVDRSSFVNGKNDTAFYRVAGWGDEHYLKDKPGIEVWGRVSFGIRTYDLMNEIPNKNGVYTVRVTVDTAEVFGIVMDELSFSTTRYLNSLIDYNYFKKKKRRMIRTQVDTNNLLSNYRNVRNNGILTFTDTLVHTVNYEVTDVYGNTAQLQFYVHARKPADSILTADEKSDTTGIYFDFSQPHYLSENNISLSFPANAFYRSFNFRLETGSASTVYAPVYHVHDKFTPVQKAFTIKIKPDSVPAHLKDKLYIAYDNGNKEPAFISARWDGEYLTAKSRLLGNYLISVDSTAPEILPLNIADGKNITGQKTIKVRIKDAKTGIKYYRGTLNGQWILMEYDAKKQLLVYTFDEKLAKGNNHFKLVVKDMLGNETIYETDLVF